MPTNEDYIERDPKEELESKLLQGERESPSKRPLPAVMNFQSRKHHFEYMRQLDRESLDSSHFNSEITSQQSISVFSQNGVSSIAMSSYRMNIQQE
jgi:hypothetical protein